MATDWWPTQEGRICDGLTLNCISEAAILEGSAVKFGTSASGQVTVAACTGLGDGWGVAVRAAGAAGDPVPILVYGLFKMTVSNGTAQPSQGQFVMNSTTIYVTQINNVGTYTNANLKVFKGTSYILGMAMQTATANADKLIIFVGKAD